jgi:hypothetical protein
MQNASLSLGKAAGANPNSPDGNPIDNEYELTEQRLQEQLRKA